ncbi:MAG TPA: DUF4402 domain-containing protein [Caulobacteraceae bacterium]|nr:DUF4402 domain-containing protein [Caulobacteraceae bacterium]
MNRLTKIALGAAAMAALSSPAFAQATSTASATGTTTIVQAITVAKNTDLAFGKLAKPTSGTSTITIDATSGARSESGAGDAALLTSTTSRATYTVTGEASTAYTITLPAGTFQMTKSGGATPLTVTLVRSATSGTLSSGGTDTFGVGGSFDIASTTETGAYSGTFDVTVAYN